MADRKLKHRSWAVTEGPGVLGRYARLVSSASKGAVLT
jgi:hypothetical protein